MARITFRTSFIALLLIGRAAFASTTVTMLQFSDYHSHALPFYSEGREDQGGIARAIAYLKREKRRGALVFNGGDMVNKGSPAWSDKYTCAEWPWLNGVVDAMAFGNHDPDYGRAAYDACAKKVRYAILSANTEGFERYVVLQAKGARIGVFAVAGRDFRQLVKEPSFAFGDPVAAARAVVSELREKEHVDVVVMIGHEHEVDDFALAHAVPGIDVIFGSHSHLKRELRKIPETETWYLAPFQYLTYVSRVEVTIDKHRVTNVRGALVPIGAPMKSDPVIAKAVRSMERALERDPQYAELFRTIGTLDAPLSVDALGARSVQLMRDAAHADVALSTTSSFRQPLPRGTITLELLRAAMPYDNELVVCTLTGAQLQRVLDVARAEGERASYVTDVGAIDPARTYRVAATDYVTNAAYRELFACTPEKTGERVRSLVAKSLSH